MRNASSSRRHPEDSASESPLADAHRSAYSLENRKFQPARSDPAVPEAPSSQLSFYEQQLLRKFAPVDHIVD